mmetsp:Transcript_124199/g.397529  ORF Transcript_124199/g.397529 Transcript_124199/m.397529 type:complete len:267 (+) Transcript_124199:766-1566(+)
MRAHSCQRVEGELHVILLVGYGESHLVCLFNLSFWSIEFVQRIPKQPVSLALLFAQPCTSCRVAHPLERIAGLTKPALVEGCDSFALLLGDGPVRCTQSDLADVAIRINEALAGPLDAPAANTGRCLGHGSPNCSSVGTNGSARSCGIILDASACRLLRLVQESFRKQTFLLGRLLAPLRLLLQMRLLRLLWRLRRVSKPLRTVSWLPAIGSRRAGFGEASGIKVPRSSLSPSSPQGSRRPLISISVLPGTRPPASPSRRPIPGSR